MKIYLFFALFTTIAISSLAQTDSTLQKLLLINPLAYNGHTVDSLVKKLPTNYTKMEVIASRFSEYGDELCVFYPNGVSIAIRVKNFKYMKPAIDHNKVPFIRAKQWNTHLFRKETIWFSIVYQKGYCYSGCQYDPVQISKP